MQAPMMPPEMQEKPPKPRRRGRIRRFFRGYFMFVGALTTAYVAIKLLVLLFVEIGKWMPVA